jgi:hypothetical protein
VSNVNLNLANNQSTKIVGARVASFTADVFGEVKNVTLDNTLHVPDLRTNLLSVSKIADKGCEILFKKNHALVFGADGNVKLMEIESGTCTSRVYQETRRLLQVTTIFRCWKFGIAV